jgi:hypothetical protein
MVSPAHTVETASSLLQSDRIPRELEQMVALLQLGESGQLPDSVFIEPGKSKLDTLLEGLALRERHEWQMSTHTIQGEPEIGTVITLKQEIARTNDMLGEVDESRGFGRGLRRAVHLRFPIARTDNFAPTAVDIVYNIVGAARQNDKVIRVFNEPNGEAAIVEHKTTREIETGEINTVLYIYTQGRVFTLYGDHMLRGDAKHSPTAKELAELDDVGRHVMFTMESLSPYIIPVGPQNFEGMRLDAFESAFPRRAVMTTRMLPPDPSLLSLTIK